MGDAVHLPGGADGLEQAFYRLTGTPRLPDAVSEAPTEVLPSEDVTDVAPASDAEQENINEENAQ